jgi:hypothetical protein
MNGAGPDRLRLLVIASRPSDYAEMAELARALVRRSHAVTLMYFFERADPSHVGVFESLRSMADEGVAAIAIDHESVQTVPLDDTATSTTPLSAPTSAGEPGAALGGLRAVALWLRARGLNVYPKNSGLARLLYGLARDIDGIRNPARRHTTVRMTAARRDQLKRLRLIKRAEALRRIHQGSAMVLHYRQFWQLFGDTIGAGAIDALLIPEDIVGKVWPVAIAAGHDRGVPTLVLPYTLANRDEAIQGLKGLPEFQTVNNRVAATWYPRWRYSDNTVDLVRLPSPHIFAHEELGIAPRDPWMMNSGYADKILVDSPASLEYFRAGGIPIEQMATVGSVSQDRIFEQRRNRDESLQALRQQLGLSSKKPLLLISGCPNQLSAPVPFCEFATIEDVARFVGDSVAPLAEHYHLVVRPHPNFAEFGRMLEPFGIKSTLAPTASLVPLADVFIAFASATIRWAIACAIPTVNYDVFHYRYGDFAAAKGVASVTGADTFRTLVQTLTPGAAPLQVMSEHAQRDSARWSAMDGRGVARIEDEIRKACRSRKRSSKEFAANA